MKEGAAIINTTLANAYKGNEVLLDYTSTKGAVEAFMRAQSPQLVKKGIRMNLVAPGPVWTSLFIRVRLLEIPLFGHDTPTGHCGQPLGVTPAHMFLALEDASYLLRLDTAPQRQLGDERLASRR